MAEVLKKQRKIRRGQRAHVTKLLVNLELSLQDELSQQKIILREKLDSLNSLHSKILELVDDENEDEFIAHEVAEASEITDEITWAVVRIDSTLKSLQINSSITSTPSASTGNVGLSPQSGLLLNGTTAALNVNICAKLPKLEMKRFNGRPTEWQAFIDCFDSAVHSNPKLSNREKMSYLKSLFEGPAAASIKGLPLTSEKYILARKILEERYGNKQLIISSHVDNLLKLPVVSSVNDVKDIRQLYDKTEIHIRGLQALGVEAQQYGSFFVPVLLSKVPQELRLIISREFDSGNWSLDELLKVFKTEVEAGERCNSMTTTPRRGNTHPSPLHQLSLLTPEGQRMTCTFCKQGHRSVDCGVITIVGERKDKLKKQGFVSCLKHSHIAKECDSKWARSNCAQRHHPGLCMANDTPTSDNTIAGVTQPSTQGSGQPSSAVSMYVDSKTSILLQTCIALASNPTSVQPQEKHCVRIILDSGSQKTNITQQLKKTLGLKPIAREGLCIKTFGTDYNNLKTVGIVQPQEKHCVRIILDSGSQKTNIAQHLKKTLGLKPIAREGLCIKTFGTDYNNLRTVGIVNLCLKNVDNDVIVTITAHVVLVICSPLNYQTIQFARKNHAHLKDIVLPQCISEENLVIDILIGADQYWNIANGEVRRGESGPITVNTRFGWTLSGPIENAPCSDTHSVNLAATHVLQIDARRDEMDVHEMELEVKLQTFWEFESIGIKQEENSVPATFRETTTFENQRGCS
ncbi:uncharacterized protein LOC110049797 [Orbicella faveolata]|uniref:uncharacterized protein LOC110049797 n=1 Tax=Orbicella faveolata TaxID=48498 RepID=UPI0009E49551|nr:uncharacterized protein LOC110049797 [Orbicella faveolata]